MGLNQPLMQGDSPTTSICQQCTSLASSLLEIVDCLNSTLGSIFAGDITVSKGQTVYCQGNTAIILYIVKSNGFKIKTPLCGHDAHVCGISNAS